MSTDTSLITFKAISNFINDFGDVFRENHPLKLYVRLINKTTIAHDKPIRKHIEAFRLFCVANRDAIATKDINGLTMSKISYSKRVFVDMSEIFKQADSETISVIWKHLLTISALVDPTGKAREILKEQAAKCGGGDEVNFLTNIISKVENKVDLNANPMEAITSIMQSGIFTDLVNGMGNGLQDGTLDLSKLLGTVQTMVTKLSGEAGDQEGGEQAVNMINTMIGSMTAGAKAPGTMPDLSGMLGPMFGAMMGGGGDMPNLAGMMGAMMGGESGSIPNLTGMMEDSTLEDQINKQVKAAKAAGKLTNKE